MLTILLVDDNLEVSEFMKEYLGRQNYSVLTASTGAKAQEIFEQTQPDLILLDLELPDVRGETLCEEFKKIHPEIPIIMLTAHQEQTDVVKGLNLGADDYLSKPVDGQELLARVKARLRDRGVDGKQLQIADLILNTETMQVYRGKQEISLTPQEFRLLEYLMLNANRVLSRDMILSRIWQTTPDIETRVVDVYIGYLRKKIDQDQPNKLIQSVRGFGYSLREADANKA